MQVYALSDTITRSFTTHVNNISKHVLWWEVGMGNAWKNMLQLNYKNTNVLFKI